MNNETRQPTTLPQVRRRLLLLLWLLLLAGATVSVLFETDMLPVGIFSGEQGMRFPVLMVMELLTICMIPLSLKLFRLRRVADALRSRHAAALLPWAVLRLSMLLLPMLGNVAAYYLFMDTSFGYMAIILLLCLPFVYPGKERCRREAMEDDPQ